MSYIKRFLEDLVLEALEEDPPAQPRHTPLATGAEENRTP